jgi:hypothetical protein
MSCPSRGLTPKFADSEAVVNLRTRDPTTIPLSTEASRSTEMKTLLLAGTTVAWLTAVNITPAMAQGPKASDDNAWPGISQRVDSGSANAATATVH